MLLPGFTLISRYWRLFLAGIVPGLMIGAMFMMYIFVHAYRHPHLAPRESGVPSLVAVILGFGQIWPLLLLILAVIGSIIAGLATPTEAAGLGVVFSAIISFIWGDLSWRKLVDAVFHATLLFASIGFVVLGATILAQSVSVLGIPQQILITFSESGLDRYSILLLIVLVYLVLGCFFDGLSLMIMTLPVVFPVLTGLGFDPIWVGVLITIVIEIGQVTPPVGHIQTDEQRGKPGTSCMGDGTLLDDSSVRHCSPYTLSGDRTLSSRFTFLSVSQDSIVTTICKSATSSKAIQVAA